MTLKTELIADSRTKEYYRQLIKRTMSQFDLASQAKQKGLDISLEVESQPVTDLAERAEKIVGPEGVAQRYRQVLKEVKGHRMEALFQIVREIIEQKWVKIPDTEKRVEQAIKTGLVLITEGVVVSPLDGLPKVLISKNYDNTPYVDIYFAGPIRAAGGSGTVIPLILADYARHLLELDRYKPTLDEVERYVEEIGIYQENLARQYKLKEDEIRTIIKGCPICINGVPTEEKEVSVHRNLERIPSNRLRGGMCLVVSEGIALKAMKILQWAKQLELDWSWLEQIIKVQKTANKITELKPSAKYLEGIAAGRPLLAYPSRFGGFRLRYGRARNTGCMAKAINPALMHLLDEFIAVGTHVKLERPGKAAQLFPCDSIEGPIVLLNDGSVRKINSIEQALEVKDEVKRILFLGDLLVALGDFRKTAHPLAPCGYNEEWWQQDWRKAAGEKAKPPEKIDFATALKLSQQLKIPLHPKFLHYFKALDKDELLVLIEAVQKSQLKPGELRLKFTEPVKKALEKIGLEHRLEKDIIVIDGEQAEAGRKIFGYGNSKALSLANDDILGALSQISGLTIKDKGGTFIGARMGRPEAAKERVMKGNPHVLFPIGWFGGNTRSINKAAAWMEEKNKKNLDLEVSAFTCPKCGKTGVFPYCHDCQTRTQQVFVCKSCQRSGSQEKCVACGSDAQAYGPRQVPLNALLLEAAGRLRVRLPDTVKGVKGMISGQKIPEPLEKGILRAKHDIHVFRDGTSRFELLNAPLTHFKPKEINLSLGKARELGYTADVKGQPLESEEQLLELFPQDIIINDRGGDWLLRMSQFVDELLERFYGLKPYYNAQNKEDLIGELVVGLAPHTSAGIVGRVIGYSSSRLGWGHPYFFMATRRNFDGDQNSIMLLLDSLLNFSHSYLADKSGGRMDTPLVFTIALNPLEIDNEVYEMETVSQYPLVLYEKSQEFIAPFLDDVALVEDKLGKPEQYSGLNFTHQTSCFDAGPKQSMYTQLRSMEEKIRRQADLQNRIAAVDGKDALERVLRSHFFPDIIGNAHSFSKQQFRCTKCNSKYRRPPLKGVCLKCGNPLILTIAEGSVRKYLEIAKQMIHEYGLSNYLKQRIELTEQEVESIFKSDNVQQKNLFEFV